MEFSEVLAYLETNKDSEDVKAYVGKLSAINLDAVKGFLESNEDGKKHITSLTDSKVTKGIDSWKTNNLQKLIDDAVKIAHPDETPQEKKIRELEAKWAESESKAQKETLRNKATTYASTKGIPLDFIEFIVSNDEESTNGNVDKIKAIWDSELQKAVDAKFKDKGYTPPNNDNLDYKGVNPWSKATLNLTEQGKILKVDPTLAAQLMKSAK